MFTSCNSLCFSTLCCAGNCINNNRLDCHCSAANNRLVRHVSSSCYFRHHCSSSGVLLTSCKITPGTLSLTDWIAALTTSIFTFTFTSCHWLLQFRLPTIASTLACEQRTRGLLLVTRWSQAPTVTFTCWLDHCSSSTKKQSTWHCFFSSHVFTTIIPRKTTVLCFKQKSVSFLFTCKEIYISFVVNAWVFESFEPVGHEIAHAINQLNRSILYWLAVAT